MPAPFFRECNADQGASIMIDLYEYDSWIAWSADEVSEYAQEVARDQQLTEYEAGYLRGQMLERCLNYDCFPLETSLLASNAETPQHTYTVVGSGLSRRVMRAPASEWAKNIDAEHREMMARKPFATLGHAIRWQAIEAHWRANCLPIRHNRWLYDADAFEPHVGFLWFVDQIERSFSGAKDQMKRGNSEAALRHAYEAGALNKELDLLLAFGAKYDKYDAVNQAQINSGQSRKVISDQARQDAYFRHRGHGAKRSEAGRLAGEELGLSEASIRASFPSAKYPRE